VHDAYSPVVCPSNRDIPLVWVHAQIPAPLSWEIDDHFAITKTLGEQALLCQQTASAHMPTWLHGVGAIVSFPYWIGACLGYVIGCCAHFREATEVIATYFGASIYMACFLGSYFWLGS